MLNRRFNQDKKEKIEEAIKSIVKNEKEKIIAVTTILALVEMAKNIDIKKMVEIERSIYNNELISFVGANYTNANIFSLGLTPAITSATLINIIRIAIPDIAKLEDEKDRKQIEKFLTVMLSLMNGLYSSFNIFDAGILLGIILALGSLLLTEIGNLLSKKGVEGDKLLISSEIIRSLSNSDNRITIIPELIISKIITDKKHRITTEVGISRKSKEKIDFKLLHNGTIPMIITTVVISFLAPMIPTIINASPIIVSIVQGIIFYLATRFLTCIKQEKMSKDICKILDTSSRRIEGISLQETPEYLNKINKKLDINSTLIYTSMVFIFNILGLDIIRIPRMMILAETMSSVTKNIELSIKTNKRNVLLAK